MTEIRAVLVDAKGCTLAELLVTEEEEGWFTGKVISQTFPAAVRKALAWYDEVVRDQMLSYLDSAIAAVEQFGPQVKLPDGFVHRVYSLHITPSGEVSLRLTPVPPPAVQQQSR